MDVVVAVGFEEHVLYSCSLLPHIHTAFGVTQQLSLSLSVCRVNKDRAGNDDSTQQELVLKNPQNQSDTGGLVVVT